MKRCHWRQVRAQRFNFQYKKQFAVSSVAMLNKLNSDYNRSNSAQDASVFPCRTEYRQFDSASTRLDSGHTQSSTRRKVCVSFSPFSLALINCLSVCSLIAHFLHQFKMRGCKISLAVWFYLWTELGIQPVNVNTFQNRPRHLSMTVWVRPLTKVVSWQPMFRHIIKVAIVLPVWEEQGNTQWMIYSHTPPETSSARQITVTKSEWQPKEVWGKNGLLGETRLHDSAFMSYFNCLRTVF